MGRARPAGRRYREARWVEFLGKESPARSAPEAVGGASRSPGGELFGPGDSRGMRRIPKNHGGNEAAAARDRIWAMNTKLLLTAAVHDPLAESKRFVRPEPALRQVRAALRREIQMLILKAT